MRFARAERYRPTRTPDGAGGFTEALVGPEAVYLSVETHSTGMRAICRTGSDVLPEDVIVVADAQYRVIGWTGHHEGPVVSLEIERVERPVVPR